MSYNIARRREGNGAINKLYPEDRAVHEWYRFVLSFPPHLVRTYLERFAVVPGQTVLDPFCGTGTVPVECKKHGIASVGLEANRMAHFASQVKTTWQVHPTRLLEHARQVAQRALARVRADGLEDEVAALIPLSDVSLRALPADAASLLLQDSISPRPLHKALVLLDCIAEQPGAAYQALERLALAKSIVAFSSNLHFGPEVGVGPAKPDAAVISPWHQVVAQMAADLAHLDAHAAVASDILRADAREIGAALPPESIDAVITSPPYPNEKDYTRTTRLESVLLGFMQGKADLRAMKQTLMRSNSRTVYRGDDDDRWVAENATVQQLASAIEAQRVALKKTSGFEKQYANVTRLYFGGMARHLAGLRAALRPGAQLAYVVGDQASFFRVHIPTGQVLAEIATSLGYTVTSIDLFRTRLATATNVQLREEVVCLRWP